MMSSDALGDAPGDRPAKGHTARLVATLAERTAALETLTKLETGERSRLEAEKFQYEAQANAALAMQRKVAQRAEAERSEWLVEKAALENELQASREALAKAQQEARQRGAEAKKASEQLAEARAEAKRLRAERETLIEQLKGGSSADEDDHLAVREQLAQTVEHASAVNRKMTKAHKTQQNVITQLESEIELLSEKVDQLEDECCGSEESRLCLEGALAEAQQRQRDMQVELHRQAKRQFIQPIGMQDLLDQLEVANDVKQQLCSDIAQFTEELAQAKLYCAQVREEADENAMRVRRADQKSRLLSLRMSKLEVELANAQNVAAEDEEQKAMVFKSVMDEQEARIRELQLQLDNAKKGKGWSPFG